MKTIAKKKKNYWQYVFWLGPFLVLMGLSASIVSGTWGLIPLGLLISGIVLCILWLLFQAYASRWWGRRSTQAGANALMATLAVLVILGLVNFLATRYSTRVDYTETGLYTLAPESRQLVNNLSEPIKVWVFDRNQNPQDRELLENYRRQGSQFSYEYVDPQARPGLAQQFGVKQFGDVYIEAGKQRRLVQTVNEQERLSEVQLTNKVQQIASDRTTKVYFLQGHGETPIAGEQQAGLSQAIGALADKNFTTEPLNLAQQPTVPKDAAVVVVAGPKRVLFDREEKALSEYLNQGGSLLLMLDPNTNPGLDSLLKNWGITLDKRLIVDPQGAAVGLGPAVPLVTSYGQHPITKDFGNGISFYRGARPIESQAVVGVRATPILVTSPQSWAESDLENKDLQFNPQSDRQGPLTLGIALSRRVEAKSESQQPEAKSSPNPSASPTPAEKSEPKPDEARLVVVGNSEFATNGLFEQQLNGDVFLNSVSWLSNQNQQLLSIRPKEAKNRRINLTQQQVTILWWTPLIFVPLIGFSASVLLWWLRR
jgi:ABC-type uncharacterized transport system involved in gliding motility auxiliary subunit